MTKAHATTTSVRKEQQSNLAAAALAAPATLASSPRLMTKQQVIAALLTEIEQTSLTETARRYSLPVQQLNDVVKGNANLSKKMAGKLRLRLHELYEKIEKGG